MLRAKAFPVALCKILSSKFDPEDIQVSLSDCEVESVAFKLLQGIHR